MKLRFENRFIKSFRKLPKHIQAKTDKALDLFETHPTHPFYPSLRIKKMQGYDGIWEGRVDRSYRFKFRFSKDENDEPVCILLDVGPHDILDRNP